MTDPRPDRISRSDALRLLGNGVIPAQAAAALRLLLDSAGLGREPQEEAA